MCPPLGIWVLDQNVQAQLPSNRLGGCFSPSSSDVSFCPVIRQLRGAGDPCDMVEKVRPLELSPDSYQLGDI